jgi:hypothetical protein
MKMRPLDRPIGHQRRRYRPELEGLEARDLPSASTGAVAVHLVPTPAPSFYPPATPVKNVYHEPLVPEGGAAALESFAKIIQDSYVQSPFAVATVGTPTTPNPSTIIQPYTPTLAELEREHFVAKYSGRYTIGPGRFSDEAYVIHAVTRSGGSNQFSRALAQLFLVEPNVSTADDPNSLVQGLGSNFPYSALASGSNLVTDFTGSTANGKQFGNFLLPTQLTWYTDSTSSGGYTTAFNTTEGAGVLEMYWIPSKTPLPGTLGSGRVIWLYQGLDNTSGVFNAIEPTLSD